VSSYYDERVGKRVTHAAGQFEDSIVLECVHARDTHDPSLAPPDPRGFSPLQPFVDDYRICAAISKRGGNVLQAQRLDTKERPKSEPVIARIWSDQKDVHISSGAPHGDQRARDYAEKMNQSRTT
jgi:hypothetical protein